MKLKQTALLVCIVYAIMAILQIIRIINFLFIEEIVILVDDIPYMFLSIILNGIVAYFFYLFLRKMSLKNENMSKT